MSIEPNKEVILRHIQTINQKTPEVWDEIMSPEYAFKVPGLPPGREGQGVRSGVQPSAASELARTSWAAAGNPASQGFLLILTAPRLSAD